MPRYRCPRTLTSSDDYTKLYMKYYRKFNGPVFDDPNFVREYRDMFKQEIEAYENETGENYKRGKGRPPKWEELAKQGKRVAPILKKNKGNYKVDLS